MLDRLWNGLGGAARSGKGSVGVGCCLAWATVAGGTALEERSETVGGSVGAVSQLVGLFVGLLGAGLRLGGVSTHWRQTDLSLR